MTEQAASSANFAGPVWDDDAPARAPQGGAADKALFNGALDAARATGDALDQAQHSEQSFESGRGGLQEMVFDRARADALLSVASSAASKAVTALNTILNMQV
jgi:flagellar hook-basal body complex protein FliE